MISCHICGEEWEGDDMTKAEPVLMLHMVMEHPLELLQSKPFQKKISDIAYEFGGKLGDYLKRKS